MAITEHPKQGSVITVDYSQGFREPEMVKNRLAIVLSPKMKARVKLITVVPLSLSPPQKTMPYHKQIDIPFELPPRWGRKDRWIKGDMVNSVGFHRANLLCLRKDFNGKRIYQYSVLPDDIFKEVRRCVLHGIGLSTLTKHL